MKINYKITIPEPCHEDWNKMTPDQTGRFCSSCVKSVVDFTNMKAPEIQDYFIKNQGKNVCGRFKTEQLDSIIIQIPRYVLFSQVQFHKMFLLALLVSMGTTLFSCQNNNGDKQKIDGVEVVDSTKELRTMGAPLPEKIIEEEHLSGDTVYTPDKTKQTAKKISAKEKKVELVTTGDVVPIVSEPINKIIEEDNFVYGGVGIEVNPDYKGGVQNFYDFFTKEYRIPRKAKKVNGTLNVSFIVEKDGSLSSFKIIDDFGFGAGDEAIRVLKLSEKWYPGEKDGKKNRTQFHLPITITNNSDKASAKITSIELIRDSIITTDN